MEGEGEGVGENEKFLMWKVYFLDEQKAEGWTGSKKKKNRPEGQRCFGLKCLNQHHFYFPFWGMNYHNLKMKKDKNSLILF